MTPANVLVESPDWEERYRLMFEKHELFMIKLCDALGIDYVTTSENDILEKIHATI